MSPKKAPKIICANGHELKYTGDYIYKRVFNFRKIK